LEFPWLFLIPQFSLGSFSFWLPFQILEGSFWKELSKEIIPYFNSKIPKASLLNQPKNFLKEGHLNLVKGKLKFKLFWGIFKEG